MIARNIDIGLFHCKICGSQLKQYAQALNQPVIITECINGHLCEEKIV